jgi:SAM-dependent methyltransferase
VTPDEKWLAAMWPFVQASLPVSPARVLEIGCGPLGGFVPRLLAAGYRATGIDPEAPEGPAYRRVEFESYAGVGPVDAVVACTSLHHVADLGEVADQVRAMLAPDGSVVVVEWASERFDEPTARWCFDRLNPPGGEHDWLGKCHSEWQSSGLPWDAYRSQWAEHERLHAGHEVVRELESRFERERLEHGPYFFAGLNEVSEADEQAAIDGGLIQANSIQYVGTPRRPPAE